MSVFFYLDYDGTIKRNLKHAVIKATMYKYENNTKFWNYYLLFIVVIIFISLGCIL